VDLAIEVVGDGGGANRLCNPGQDARSRVALIAKTRAIRCEKKRVKFLVVRYFTARAKHRLKKFLSVDWGAFRAPAKSIQ
jgi:hypothetical protein